MPLSRYLSLYLKLAIHGETPDNEEQVGNETVLSWYQDGQLHRDGDRPAVVSIDMVEGIITAIWYQQGLKHRGDDKPAVESMKSANSYRRMWFKDDQLHRETKDENCKYKPAVIEVNRNVTVIEEWKRNGGPILEHGVYKYRAGKHFQMWLVGADGVLYALGA